MSKESIRRSISHKLKFLSHSKFTNQSQNAYQVFKTLPDYQKAQNIALFMSMPLEIDTSKIIEQCFEDEKNVFLPRCNFNKEKKTHYLTFHHVPSLNYVKSLEPIGKYGIKEPKETLPEIFQSPFDGKLDLILVPGVGFEIDNNEKIVKRIGHGVGYYDEFLFRLNEKPKTIGIGLEEQLIKNLPVNEYDYPLDGLIINDLYYEL